MVLTDTRLLGVDTNGYPAQPDADAIIRSVDNELMQAMDLTVPLLTLVGGLSGFMVNAVRHSWVEDDLWRRRITTWTSIATDSEATLTITAQARRYPPGTILNLESELMRVTSTVSADVVGVTRGYAGTTPAAHTNTTIPIIVAGASMHESDNWTYRPTPVVTLPFNFCQLDHIAIRNSWRRQEAGLYGITGASDLDKNTADTLAQKLVAIEGGLVNGERFVGTSAEPATAGGLRFYITGTNGASVTDKSGAALQLADIYTMIHNIVNVVGMENVGRTIVVDRWGKEKISSFFAGSRRLGNSERVGGSVIDTLTTEWGDFQILMHYSLPPGNLYLLNTQFIAVGHFGQTGLLHVGEVPQNEGPFSGRYVYSDWSTRVKNIATMGRIHNYSVTS
jgi:hypothetical protein